MALARHANAARRHAGATRKKKLAGAGWAPRSHDSDCLEHIGRQLVPIRTRSLQYTQSMLP